MRAFLISKYTPVQFEYRDGSSDIGGKPSRSDVQVTSFGLESTVFKYVGSNGRDKSATLLKNLKDLDHIDHLKPKYKYIFGRTDWHEQGKFGGEHSVITPYYYYRRSSELNKDALTNMKDYHKSKYYISGQHALFQYRKKGDWLDMLNLSPSHVWYSSKVTKPKSKTGKIDVYVIQKSGWYIKDVNSLNGTKVNGELLPAQNKVDDSAERYKVQQEAIANVSEVGRLLKSGDVITMGIDRDYTFYLEK